MAESKYSGIKAVEYQATGGNWSAAVSLGEVIDDSEGYKADVKTVGLSQGAELYAGKENSFSCKVYDLAKFDALETLMKEDSKIDIRFKDMEDNYHVVVVGGLPIVQRIYGVKPGERNHFIFSAKIFTT